jgi:hypothetical protein
VNRKENFEKFTITALLRVESDAHNLRVPRPAPTDGRIAWAIQLTAAIAGHDRLNAGHLLEHGFQTPEASTPKRCNLVL